MTNHLFKAIQQSRAEEPMLDVIEFLPKAYETEQLADGTRLVDIFPDGLIAVFNRADRAIVIEPATEAKREVFFGKGIEECIETQRQINARPKAFGLDLTETDSVPARTANKSAGFPLGQ